MSKARSMVHGSSGITPEVFSPAVHQKRNSETVQRLFSRNW
jgi:hypothetical protein